MTATPLTAAQTVAVTGLVSAGRLHIVPADPQRAASFIAQCADKISQLPLLTSDSVRYGLAYDAAHDVGEALLAAYGYRTVNGPGQHVAVGMFLEAVLDSPPAVAAAAAQYDVHRRGRNQRNYQARAIGAAQVRVLEQVAVTLHAAAVARGVS